MIKFYRVLEEISQKKFKMLNTFSIKRWDSIAFKIVHAHSPVKVCKKSVISRHVTKWRFIDMKMIH